MLNTVYTVGVMGKGIALQFHQAFPDNYDAHVRAYERGEVQPGHMFVFHRLTHPRWIINFPTKRDWRHRARMADIESGLIALIETVRKEDIKSIAVPPLGCGNGGLDWGQVRPRIESAFKSYRTKRFCYTSSTPGSRYVPLLRRINKIRLPFI